MAQAMVSKKTAAVLLSMAVLAVSCRKHITDSPAKGPGLPDHTKISGQFDVQKNVMLYDTASYTDYYLSARCSDSLVSEFDPTGIDAGSIEMNGLSLHKTIYNPPLADYFLSASSISTGGSFSWQISGNGAISGFSFVNPNQLPHYSGQALLPDTIYAGSGAKFRVLNYYGADKIEVQIQANPMSTPVLSFSPSPVPADISYSPQQLSSLFHPGSFDIDRLTLSFYKNNYQTINGRIYNFRTVLVFTKLVVVVGPQQ